MLTRFRLWQSNLPYADPLHQRQAQTLQGLLLIMLGAAVLNEGDILFTPMPLQNRLILSGVDLLIVLGLLFVLRLLRRGRLPAAARATVAVLLLASILVLCVNGLRGREIILLAFVLPIAMAGLLLTRRGLVLTVLFSLASAVGIAFLELQGVTLIGRAPSPTSYVSTLTLFSIAIGLLGVFLDRFGAAPIPFVGEIHSTSNDPQG